MFTEGKIFKIITNKISQKGQTLVEMAIILPLLLFLILGIFEFGRAMYLKNTLNNAARAGVRTAVVQTTVNNNTTYSDCTSIPSNEPIKKTICESIFNIPKSEISANITVLGSNPARTGDTIEVNVTWNNFQTLTLKYTGMNLKITNILTGKAAMRYE